MRSIYVSTPVLFLLLGAALCAYSAVPEQVSTETIAPIPPWRPAIGTCPRGATASRTASRVHAVPEMPSATMELKWEDLAAC